jgi:hypothetical protein
MPLVHKVFFPAAAIALLVFAGCAGAPEPLDTSPGAGDGAYLAPEVYRQRIVSLLETFDGIVMTADEDDELAMVYREIRPLLVEGAIRVQADFEPMDSPFSRGRFTLDGDSGTAVLLIHHSLLEGADENPVPALTSYAGLIAFLQDYADYRGEVENLYADPLEYYLARMDAIYLQGLFARDFALPLYGEQSFSDFEYYVLQSLEADGFSTHSLFVWSIDKDIVYSMLGLSTQYGRGGVSTADYVEEVLLLGREVRDNMERSRRLFEESGEGEGDDRRVARRAMYIASTSANTYRTLGSVIFAAMIESVASDEEFEANSDALAEINEIYSLLEAMIGELADFRREYREEYLSSF